MKATLSALAIVLAAIAAGVPCNAEEARRHHGHVGELPLPDMKVPQEMTRWNGRTVLIVNDIDLHDGKGPQKINTDFLGDLLTLAGAKVNLATTVYNYALNSADLLVLGDMAVDPLPDGADSEDKERHESRLKEAQKLPALKEDWTRKAVTLGKTVVQGEAIPAFFGLPGAVNADFARYETWHHGMVPTLLERPMSRLTADGLHLSDVVDFFRDVMGLKIAVNWKALEAVGVSKDSSVTRHLHNCLPGRTLQSILDDVAGDHHRLAMAMKNETLLISTVDDLKGEKLWTPAPVPDFAIAPEMKIPPALVKLKGKHICILHQIDFGDAFVQLPVNTAFLAELCTRAGATVETGDDALRHWRKAADVVVLGEVYVKPLSEDAVPIDIARHDKNEHLRTEFIASKPDLAAEGAKLGKTVVSDDGLFDFFGLTDELTADLIVYRNWSREVDMHLALSRKLPGGKLDNVGLADALDFLRDVSELNFIVNWRAVENAGIKKDTPVSGDLADMDINKALHTVLDTAAGKGKLTFQAKAGVITVSTVEELKKQE